jgi:hypothetical protein
MALRTLLPNRRDLSEIELAIASFPGAWGCVNPLGKFTPSINPHVLWLMFDASEEQMVRMWKNSGLATGDSSSLAAMRSGSHRNVCVTFFKVRTSLFRSAWVGNVDLGFDHQRVYIGSIGGRTQVAMWRQFRNFNDGDGALFDSTAIASSERSHL